MAAIFEGEASLWAIGAMADFHLAPFASIEIQSVPVGHGNCAECPIGDGVEDPPEVKFPRRNHTAREC